MTGRGAADDKRDRGTGIPGRRAVRDNEFKRKPKVKQETSVCTEAALIACTNTRTGHDRRTDGAAATTTLRRSRGNGFLRAGKIIAITESRSAHTSTEQDLCHLLDCFVFSASTVVLIHTLFEHIWHFNSNSSTTDDL